MSEYTRKPSTLNLEGSLSDNWRKFKQNYNIYMVASEKNEKSSEIKANVLLSLAGEDAVELFNTFGLEDEDKKDEAKIIEAFESYCNPKKNVIYERFKFHKREQLEGESFNQFLADVKKLAQTCEFTTFRDEMIRDRLVIGIRDTQLQQRLLDENDLNLDKVINAGRTAEISKKQAKTLQGKHNSHVTQNESINVIEKRTNKKKSNHALNSTNVSPGKFKCTRCTRIHGLRECPAFNRKCEKCGKLNHFAVACRVRMVRQLEESVEVGPNNSSQGDNNTRHRG
uniref:Uncharacterized protein LOC114324156 n=1 Tax=Diabrotica virgifera virgifera TaxID=50390 RepID=A0A6P7EX44_DIAVI